jgi:hypothetical protein
LQESIRPRRCGMNKPGGIFVSSGAGPDFRPPVEVLSQQF